MSLHIKCLTLVNVIGYLSYVDINGLSDKACSKCLAGLGLVDKWFTAQTFYSCEGQT